MSEPNENATEPNQNATGLPLLRTWRAVYVAVVAVFVFWVIVLTALSRAFS